MPRARRGVALHVKAIGVLTVLVLVLTGLPISWVPDAFLTEQNFKDDTGKLYDPADCPSHGSRQSSGH